jgi:hypothetical protein
LRHGAVGAELQMECAKRVKRRQLSGVNNVLSKIFLATAVCFFWHNYWKDL